MLSFICVKSESSWGRPNCCNIPIALIDQRSKRVNAWLRQQSCPTHFPTEWTLKRHLQKRRFD